MMHGKILLLWLIQHSDLYISYSWVTEYGDRCIPGKSAINTTSVWLSSVPSISENFVLHGDKSTSRGMSHGLVWNGDQSAFTISTRGSNILQSEEGKDIEYKSNHLFLKLGKISEGTWRDWSDILSKSESILLLITTMVVGLWSWF